MKKLEGKIIKKIYLNKPQEEWRQGIHDLITFETDYGLISYRLDGDCCSTSWFSDLIYIKDIIGKKIISVEMFDPQIMGYDVNDGRQMDIDQAYGFLITVDGEYSNKSSIIFRNSSNGYYGGNIFNVDEHTKEIEINSNWKGRVNAK